MQRKLHQKVMIMMMTIVMAMTMTRTTRLGKGLPAE